MSYKNLQKIYPAFDPAASAGLLDYSTTDGGMVWLPAEKMVVYGFGVIHVEAVGTFNTTTPVITFAYDASNDGTTVSKGTLSPTNGKVIYSEEADVSGITSFTVNPGDALEFNVSTAGAGDTTTGEGMPFVYAEVFPALAP